MTKFIKSKYDLVPNAMLFVVACCIALSTFGGCQKDAPGSTQNNGYFVTNQTGQPTIFDTTIINLRSGVTPAVFYSSGSGTTSNYYISKAIEETAINLNEIDSITYEKVSNSWAQTPGLLIANFDITWHYKKGKKHTEYGWLSKYYGVEKHTDNARAGILHRSNPIDKIVFRQTDSIEVSFNYFLGKDIATKVWKVSAVRDINKPAVEMLIETRKRDATVKTNKNFTLQHYF